MMCYFRMIIINNSITLMLDGVYRQSYEDFVESGGGPAIPVQPISYGDAIHFIK